MIKKIDHIGIAVKNLKKQIRFYNDVLGIECTGIEEIADQKVKVAMFPLGDVRIELLEPTSPDSPIARFMEKKGEGIHHIAFQVEDLKGQLMKFEEKDIRLIDQEPRVGAGGHKIAFLNPLSTFGVLTELCEFDP
jgi:methylmalonyl-CoA/ethylmalonyl-CoA epimerase